MMLCDALTTTNAHREEKNGHLKRQFHFRYLMAGNGHFTCTVYTLFSCFFLLFSFMLVYFCFVFVVVVFLRLHYGWFHCFIEYIDRFARWYCLVSFALNVHISNGKNITTPNTQVKHYKMVRVLKSNSSAPKISSIEIDEPHEHNETIWRAKMHRIAIEFASTFVGQAIMMQFDKLLWTLEKTATWISSGKSGKRPFKKTTCI